MAEPSESPTPMSIADAVTLASGLLDQNRLNEAEQILGAVLTADPKSPDALHFMGLLRCQQERPEEAIQLIRRAIGVAPTYAEAHHNLGNILRALGRPAEAMDAFRRTIELAPDIAQTHLSMADLLRRAGRRAEAVPFYLRALELQPDLSEAHFQLGKIYYRLGRPADAAATFGKWQRLDSANPVARHMVEATSGTLTMERASDGYVKCEFDDFADTFDEVMTTLDYSVPKQIARALAIQVDPKSQLDILDAGCGTGLVGAAIHPWARHLTGVDLSANMIEQARKRGGYDELILSELTSFLQTATRKFDLVVSADTFIYFGNLSAVFRGIAGAVRPGGLFIFSIEHLIDNPAKNEFRIQPHGRYSHTESHVRACLKGAGLRLLRFTEEVIRLELREPVVGLIVTATAER